MVLHTAHLSNIHHPTLADVAWSFQVYLRKFPIKYGSPNLPESTLAVVFCCFSIPLSSPRHTLPHTRKHNSWKQGGPLLVTHGHKTPRNDLEFSVESFHPTYNCFFEPILIKRMNKNQVGEVKAATDHAQKESQAVDKDFSKYVSRQIFARPEKPLAPFKLRGLFKCNSLQ